MNQAAIWPDGARCAVALSVNVDAEDYDLLSTTPERLFGRFSYGRYGMRAGLPRLLDLLEREAVPATFFVTGSDARRHADRIRLVASRGHEIAARGMSLARPEPDAEAAWLQQGRDAIGEVTGKAPSGYRAPQGELTPATLHHLAELGFAYDASFQDDDLPYRFGLGSDRSIVEIPACYALDDAPAYSARHTHARVLKIWQEEFDALYDAGGLVPLTLHLRGDFGSTRAARIRIVEAFIRHAKARPGVVFMRMDEIARLAVQAGLPAEPDPAAAHLETLRNTPYRGDLAVKPH